MAEISILCKTAYRVDVTIIKIPMVLLLIQEKKNLLKFIRNHKRPKRAKAIRQTGGKLDHVVPHFKYI